MTKNADFGPNLAVFGPKILIFMGVSKSFGTNITDNHLDNLSAFFFWSGSKSNGPKMPIFGPNLAVYGPKILIFMGVSKTFGTHITKKPPRQLVQIVFWSVIGSNGPKMPIFGQKCQFWAKFDLKIWIFGAKSQFFV